MELTFRLARKEDIPDIVRMLADDVLGADRENADNVHSDKYLKAFDRIIATPNQELTVVEMDGELVGTFQLTFIQYLINEGGLKVLVEAVRTKSSYRGQGIGKKAFEYIVNRAKAEGAYMVQLTSDKKRVDAIRFYESVGFKATHEGMKMRL
jgi:GNAT superfamily N-acetyltransferase